MATMVLCLQMAFVWSFLFNGCVSKPQYHVADIHNDPIPFVTRAPASGSAYGDGLQHKEPGSGCRWAYKTFTDIVEEEYVEKKCMNRFQCSTWYQCNKQPYEDCKNVRVMKPKAVQRRKLMRICNTAKLEVAFPDNDNYEENYNDEIGFTNKRAHRTVLNRGHRYNTDASLKSFLVFSD